MQKTRYPEPTIQHALPPVTGRVVRLLDGYPREVKVAAFSGGPARGVAGSAPASR